MRYLVGRLFEQLVPLHGYGPVEREIIDAAAWLHDMGTLIGYDNHHKHFQTLIESNGLAGYRPREIALIALLARYHRNGTPDISGYQMVLDDSGSLLLTRLLALLRLAEFLERGRTTTVDDIILNWDDGSLRVTIIAA